MKKIKFLIFLLSVSFIGIVNAGIKYRYVCDNFNCYNTTNNFLADHYLYDVEKKSFDNFSNYIDIKLSNDYVDYYQEDAILTIEGYCTTSTCSTLEYKELTLEGLLDIENQISIGKEPSLGLGDNIVIETYNSGKDYLFSNFIDVINELHLGFPFGDKQNQLNDILENILSYNTDDNTFDIKNVCFLYNTHRCGSSNRINISYNDNGSYKFLTGEKKSSISFNSDTFKVSDDYNVSNLFLKAGESLDFNFGFEDYLDYSADFTEYEYRIYYNYEGEAVPAYNDFFLKETIKIATDDFSISSPNITQDIIGDIVDSTILDEEFKKIRIGIKEGIILNKVGKINFYLSAKNVNTGDQFDIKKINDVPVTVLPNDNITKGISEIISTFNEILNSEALGFNIGDTFSILIKLEDEFGNTHFDNISGYDISLSNGSSEFIELSDYGSDVYSDTLTGIKSSEVNGIQSLIFKFRVTETGYHDLKGFDIKIQNKQDIDNYLIPAVYTYIENIIPSNLYNSEDQLMKIFIKDPIVSDLPVSCGQSVIIEYVCTSDNFSGCNPSQNTSIFFDDMSSNGTTGFLTIKDFAYNVKNYTYTMNHIDQTAPDISVYKELNSLDGNNYEYKANLDDLIFKFYESTTSNCEAEVNYEIRLNGIIIDTGSEIGANSEVTITDFFKTTGSKELYVKTTDKYGNFDEKIINFTVYPKNVDTLNSIVYPTGFIRNTKYANHSDEYEYIIELKDEYGNPVYNKTIDGINQKCGGIPSCNTIRNNMFDNTGDNSLIETPGFGLVTNVNGKTSFKINSYAPGSFTELFEIKINDWNEEYLNLGTENSLIIGNSLNSNTFKKPFIGELKVTSNTGSSIFDSIPVLGTTQKYKVELLKLTNLGYSNGDLNIIGDNTIKNTDLKHIFEDFNNVDNSFGNDFSNYLGFTTRINAEENILKAPNIISDNLVISYNLDGKNVKYVLSQNDDIGSTINLEISGEDQTTLGLRIIGTLQGDGKGDITGQEENFSDLLKSDIRSEIRKNAYLLMKNMQDGDVLNNVKYTEGDINISGNIFGYETLVVKNGNVIIDGNLNTFGKKLGIIVLKDSYNVKTDYDISGNIYITPNVTYIDAILYADGGLISADVSGLPFIVDSSERTGNLQNQLVLKGSVFTRNTIGGAVLATGYYLLPGGERTLDFDNTLIYDLNYIRRGNNLWDGIDVNNDGNEYNDGYSDPFIIKYNPIIQINPPKGFGE